MQCPSDAESIAECSATIDSDGSCLESNGAGVKCYSSKFLYYFNKTNKQANTYYFLQIETKCNVSNFFFSPLQNMKNVIQRKTFGLLEETKTMKDNPRSAMVATGILFVTSLGMMMLLHSSAKS